MCPCFVVWTFFNLQLLDPAPQGHSNTLTHAPLHISSNTAEECAPGLQVVLEVDNLVNWRNSSIHCVCSKFLCGGWDELQFANMHTRLNIVYTVQRGNYTEAPHCVSHGSSDYKLAWHQSRSVCGCWGDVCRYKTKEGNGSRNRRHPSLQH